MKLHQVQIIGLHSNQALFDAGEDVVSGEYVWTGLPAYGRSANQTAALAREIIFGAPVRNIAADPLLANAVIDRSVDEVDTGVEHGIQYGFSLRVRGVPRPRGAAY